MLPLFGGKNDTYRGNTELNYTIVMDNAAGPATENTHLQLRLRPNPVFIEIQESDREYTGPDDRITILVC